MPPLRLSTHPTGDAARRNLTSQPRQTSRDAPGKDEADWLALEQNKTARKHQSFAATKVRRHEVDVERRALIRLLECVDECSRREAVTRRWQLARLGKCA